MDHGTSKIVVVTGGRAGIGLATVREFARNGYETPILARGREGLEPIAGAGFMLVGQNRQPRSRQAARS